MSVISFAVFGTPRTKQSARFVGGRVVSVAQANVKLKLYTEAVRKAAAEAAADDPETAARLYASKTLIINASFYFAAKNPALHWKPCTRRVDVDNLTKALLDAMQKTKLLKDDSRVVSATVTKLWGPRSGLAVWVGEHGSVPDD